YVTFFIFIASAVIIGVVLGFGFSRFNKKTTNGSGVNKAVTQSAGVVDKKTFKDSAEGVLREGGIDGEGNFHLERPGGVSQNVYMTSTTVDLSNYIGKKVKVWGQTFQAEKAGWLMDVGSVEVQK
ncbi:MAG: hypothetical protein Q7J11_01850, partial [Candidatus Roizmanbacteria bacterium]|nr:hypothetical protein [Candidatus Roizmanbacteria bacterium]